MNVFAYSNARFSRGTARKRFQSVVKGIFEPGYRPRAISVDFHMGFKFNSQMRFRLVVTAVSGDCWRAFSFGGQSDLRFPKIFESDFARRPKFFSILGRLLESVFCGGQRLFRFWIPFCRCPERFSSVGDRPRAILVGGQWFVRVREFA